MPVLDSRIRVFEPTSTQALLDLRREHPTAVIMAGGSYLMSRAPTSRTPIIAPVVISLRRVEELTRITRSERYIEIGSTATITSILETGANVAPAVLRKALTSIGYAPTRNSATLGGNLCIEDMRLSAFPVLMLLDAQIELKRSNFNRWISISRFAHPDGTLALGPHEVCTRIRIPLGEWNVQEYDANAPAICPSAWSLSFAAVANTRKGTLSDFRFVFGSMGKTVLRAREIEAELISRKLPLGSRDREHARARLSQLIDSLTPGLTDPQHRSALRYLDWFLVRLGTD